MIRVEYDPRQLRLRVQGHAGLAPRGQDVLCAGVSVLVYTLVAALAETGDGACWRLQPGDALVCADPHSPRAEPLRLQFDTLCRGFELLATQYPGSVSYEQISKGGYQWKKPRKCRSRPLPLRMRD